MPLMVAFVVEVGVGMAKASGFWELLPARSLNISISRIQIAGIMVAM